MIDLHMVSWNRPKMTELVIRTIHRNTKPNTYNLVVFDNGSLPEVKGRLKFLYHQGFINSLYDFKKNYGLEFGRQFLYENHVSSKYFVDIDNDCLPPPQVDSQDWLERLTDLMERHEDYAAISCRTQVMIGTGNIFEQTDENGNELTDFPHPGGSLRIMRTSAVNEVGGWGRETPGRGAEERLICGKLREAGYKTAFATNIRTLHLFGTRGDDGTDRWGYGKDMQPADTGHSDIWHPALANGDDFNEVATYSGTKLAKEYFDADSDN